LKTQMRMRERSGGAGPLLPPGSPWSSTSTRNAASRSFLPFVRARPATPVKQILFAGARGGSGPQMRSPGLQSAPAWPAGSGFPGQGRQPQTRLSKLLAWRLPPLSCRACSQLPWMQGVASGWVVAVTMVVDVVVVVLVAVVVVVVAHLMWV